MAKGHKPKAGSRAFWPRKRAKRIYPRVRSTAKPDKVQPLEFAGYKAGMTQVSYVDNRKNSPTNGQLLFKSATVLDCPSLVVCGIKAYKKTAYGLKDIGTVLAEKIDKNLERKTRVPKKLETNKKLEKIEKDLENISEIRLLVHTKPKESALGKKKPELFEIELSGNLKSKWDYAKGKLGTEIKPEEIFKEGEYIDASAVSKGKGFQGVVKRFGVKIRSRKNKGKQRHIGTMGPVTPGKVLPGKIPQAGQMGFQTRTEYNKRVLKIGEGGLTPKGGWINYGVLKGNYLLLQGSVPGPVKRLIILRKGNRAKKEDSVKLESVSLESHQGV